MPAHRTTEAAGREPGEHRPRCTVIYDAECAYCRAQVDRMRRGDRGGEFEFVPSKAPELPERFPQLTGADLNTGLRMVEPGGKVHVGADAVYRISRRLRGTCWFAWLYRVPGIHWLARRTYARIAARRHRLRG